MKSVRFQTDFRLALPVFIAWIALAVLLLLSPSGPVLGQPLLISLVAVLLLSGLYVIRLIPSLGMCFIAVGSLFFAYAVLSPNHIERQPWDHVPEAEIPWWSLWAEELRQRFLDASSGLPSFGGELIAGLAIGNTSRVSEHLSEAMKTVSLTHITAVSGANCVIVTASVMALAAICGAGRKTRLVIAFVALVAFVILVTPQPSVLRAAVMASIVIFSWLGGRPGTGIPLLASATMLMLLWNPWWAIDFGFILSVVATAGLLLFSQPLTASLSRWLPLWLATLVAVPLAAQLMCQPFIILLAPQLPTYGILANVLAAPAAPMATILGLIACVLVAVFPLLATLVLWCAWLPAEWIGQTAQFVAALPQSHIPWFEGVIGSISAGLLSLLTLVVLLSTNKKVQVATGTVLVISVVVWLSLSVISTVRFTNSLPPNWEIAACDVGQGDGLVLRSQGQIMVIDVGRKPAPMRECLEKLSITHIDVLVLTHYDKDHVGGLDSVIGKVERAIVGLPENTEDQSLLSQLSQSGASVERGLQDLEGTLGLASWKVLWPDGQHPVMEVGNPGSVTLLVAFPHYRALFLGDLGKESQLELMRDIDMPHVDVVKVAHHGSADQSSTFYSQLKPSIGLFSVGQDNEYDHPRQETLTLLTEMGVLIPRTDEDGLILISPETSGLSVWTER